MMIPFKLLVNLKRGRYCAFRRLLLLAAARKKTCHISEKITCPWKEKGRSSLEFGVGQTLSQNRFLSSRILSRTTLTTGREDRMASREHSAGGLARTARRVSAGFS